MASARRMGGAGMVQARGGPFLTDGLGRTLQLHGVNLVAKCGGGSVDMPQAGTPCVGPAQGPRLAYVLSPDADDPGRRFTAADAQTLVGLGFNTVRLGIIWEGLEPGPADARINDPHYCAAPQAGHPVPEAQRPGRSPTPATVRAYLAKTDRIVAAAGSGRAARDRGHALRRLRIGVLQHQGDHAVERRGGAPCGRRAPAARSSDRPPGWGIFYLLHPIQVAMHHFFANDVRGDLQGAVRPRVAGRRAPLPGQPRRPGLRDLQRAQRLPGQAVRPRVAVRLRRHGQRAQVLRRQPPQRAAPTASSAPSSPPTRGTSSSSSLPGTRTSAPPRASG